MTSQFKDRVLLIVSKIPYGKVASYGQVALLVGAPRAARQVGWILRGLGEETNIPWWRVVNNKGYISIKASRFSANEQKTLLDKEGIKVKDDFTFDLEIHRYRPGKEVLKEFGLSPEYLEMISCKIQFS